MWKSEIKNKIHIKVLTLLLCLAAIFISALLILKNFENEKVQMLINDEKNEHAALLENSVEKLGEGLFSFADDYSRWDEMVRFIKTPEHNWARINIEAAFPIFNLQVVWVFDDNFMLKYNKSVLKNNYTGLLPVSNGEFRNLFKSNSLCHFYMKTPDGILEVCGAPVQPTGDLSRKTRPQGYLFAGRIWSQKHLREISALIKDSIRIYDAGNKISNPAGNEHFFLENSKKLLSWDNKVTAVVTARKAYNILRKVYGWADVQYLSVILFTVVLLLCISVFLFFTVNYPLSVITKSLRTGSMGFLKKIKRRKDEFGELACLMEEFYSQKQTLETEIENRHTAEAELRKMKDELEARVINRTTELAEVNKQLEQEIIERNKARLELQQFHQRLTSAYFANPDSINISRLNDGLIIDANESFCRLTGFGKVELLGKTSLQLDLWVRPPDRVKLMERLLSDNSISSFETDFMSKDKTLKAVSISAAIMEYGEEKAIIFMIRDISGRKRMETELIEYKLQLEGLVAQRTDKLNELNKSLEEQLEKAEKTDSQITDLIIFFKALLDTIPIPMLIQDVNNTYTECNQAAEIFFGMPKSELIELLTSSNPLTPGSSPNQTDARFLKDKAIQKFESKVILPGGRIRNVVIYRSAYKKNNQQPGGIITAVFDITDRKESEVKLLYNLEKEKELNELKSRFISTASHQFRTPLAIIQSSTDLLEMFGRKWKVEQYSEQLSIIQNQIRQMTELLNDVLTVSKAEMGKVEFRPSTLDLYQMCLDSFNAAKAIGREYHTFVFNYKLNQKNACLDRKLLVYILNNLLSNAVKYTVKKGEIRLEVAKEEGFLMLEVSDQGIGIPSKDMLNLFEPFHRSDNTCDLPGTGLGLSIVKKAVELHEGRIICNSSVDKGTTFKVLLPLIDPEQETGNM